MTTQPKLAPTTGQEKRDAALRQAGANRTNEAVKKAEKGIRQLLKDGGVISFSAVARAGGVSTKFLHQNKELSERIRHLATTQKGTPTRAPETALTGESAIIAALRRQLHNQDEHHKTQVGELKTRIRELEEQNQVLYGKLAQYEGF